MAFFRPLISDTFFSTPSSALFSPSSSLLFDDDPLFSATPLNLYDQSSLRRRAGGRKNAANIRQQQQQLKEQQSSSEDNTQAMVSGGGEAAADKAVAPAAATTTSIRSPTNKQAALANSNSSLRQPRLLSPLSMLSALSPATSLLSSTAVLPSMSVDLMSTDTEYTVNASVPGVAKQDLKVTVDDGVLTIEAERREQTKQSSEANNKSTATTSSRQQQQDKKEREEKAAVDNSDTQHQLVDAEQDDSSPLYHHVESFYGHISRSITLPDDCNTDGMTAKYENGVLAIVIPRLQQRKKRGTRLEIQ